MNRFNDLALDFGEIALDNERKNEIDDAEGLSVQLKQRDDRAVLFHREALQVAKRFARIDRRLAGGVDSAATRL